MIEKLFLVTNQNLIDMSGYTVIIFSILALTIIGVKIKKVVGMFSGLFILILGFIYMEMNVFPSSYAIYIYILIMFLGITQLIIGVYDSVKPKRR